MKIAITGATGFVGKRLVETLSKSHQVVALSRSPNSQANIANCDWRSGDLYSLLDAERMLMGVDVAIYLVHSMLPTSRLSQGSFRDFDAILADNFARACEKNSVKHIIYLGGLIPRKRPDMSEHLDSRKEVEDILTSYRPAVTVLRSGLIFGAGGSSFEILYKLISRLPIIICPAWMNTQTQPVSIQQIILSIQYCIEHENTYKKTYDIGGKNKFTYRQMMEQTAKLMSKARLFIPIPFVSAGLSGFWLSLITGAPRGLAKPLIRSLRYEMVCRADHELQISGFFLQDFSEFAKMAIDESRAKRIHPRAFQPPPQTKEHSLVKSVQRLPLPDQWTMDQVVAQYCHWLKRAFRPFLNINLDTPGRIEIKINFLNIKMLVLQRDDSRCTVDRQLLRITGGFLAKLSPKARLEFRELPYKSDFIVAIHDYEPKLPWFIYRLTQAIAHKIVMSLFGHHLRNVQRRLKVA